MSEQRTRLADEVAALREEVRQLREQLAQANGVHYHYHYPSYTQPFHPWGQYPNYTTPMITYGIGNDTASGINY